MEVDLLVCSYNTKEYLEQLLVCLNMDYEPNVWNLYVQDNGSTDGSVQWLAENADKYRVKQTIISSNVGYARAINNMASKSHSELLAAVNADTWFNTKHVKQIIQTFQDNPNQGVVGPKQMDMTKRIRHGGILWNGRGRGDPVHRGWNQFDPMDELYKDRQKCWTVSGSLYYTRRSIWDELTNEAAYQDLFDEKPKGAFLLTPHYFEETFYSVHAQKHGYEVWYDGTVDTAGHIWHASATVGEPSRQYFVKSQGIYRYACDTLGIEHELP